MSESIDVRSGSLASYARRRGVSTAAVSKAVKRGRLRKSVSHRPTGEPFVADFEMADREWVENASKTYRGRRQASCEPAGRIHGDDSTLTDEPPESLSVITIVGQRGEHLMVAGGVTEKGDGDVRLVVSRDTAAALGLRLWCAAGGDQGDLLTLQARARKIH